MTVRITHYTDPACPFAFSAEPVRTRVRWHYGDQLGWRHVMIVLTDGDRHEAERLAEGAPTLQRLYGMPIDPAPRRRPASSEPGCRAVVAARLFAPAAEEPLLRSLSVRGMAGALLDDPDLIAAAAHDAGLHAGRLAGWLEDDRATDALAADMRAARSPSAVALALGHKLGGHPGARRYSAPSCELAGDAGAFTLPGFTPVEALEAAIANLEPGLVRRPRPRSARELLEWAGEPLATAEIVLAMAGEPAAIRAELARTAHRIPSGADAYWTLEPTTAPASLPGTARAGGRGPADCGARLTLRRAGPAQRRRSCPRRCRSARTGPRRRPTGRSR